MIAIIASRIPAGRRCAGGQHRPSRASCRRALSQNATGVAGKPAAPARRARLVDRRPGGRPRHRVLRQDGHGPGRRRRHRADRRGRARRGVRSRHGRDGRHRASPATRAGRPAPPASSAAAPRCAIAAAEARRVLVARAAEKLGVPVDQLRVQNGVVSVTGDAQQKRRLRRADRRRALPSQARVEQAVRQSAGTSRARRRRRTPPSTRWSARSIPQAVIADKIHGRPAVRHRREGRRHAARARHPAAERPAAVRSPSTRRRSPRIPGAASSARKTLIAVVAEREWDAVRAARALKVHVGAAVHAVPARWRRLHDHIRQAKSIGSADAGQQGRRRRPRSRGAQRVIEAEYEWPLQSHASMGPACAVADVRADGATLWTGSQKPHYGRDGIAKLVGLPPEKVRAIWIPGPGSYGRNDAGDAAARRGAALQAHRQAGARAVHAARRHGLGPEGAGGRVSRPRGAGRAGQRHRLRLLRQGLLAPGRRDHGAGPEGHARRATHRLRAESRRSSSRCRPRSTTSRTSAAAGSASRRCSSAPRRCARGHLRDPLGPETHFASESFIDEIAHATGEDPVAFRLKYLKDPRHAAVIKAAAAKAGWTGRPPNPKRGQGAVMTGRGFSYTERNGDRRGRGGRRRRRSSHRARVGAPLHGGARLRAHHQPERARAHHRRQRRAGACRARCSRKCASIGTR